MMTCRDESGGSDIDGRAAGDLERLARRAKTERGMAFRAEVILAIAEGLSNKAVAERVGARPATVSKWRGRFAQAGLSGLRDASRSGKPRQYQDEHERRILAALDEPPPAGYGRWDGGLLAPTCGGHLQTSDLARSAPA